MKCSFITVFTLLLPGTADAQWVSNPEKNTLFVTNCFNPINISSVDDQKGGVFIFWEDNINGFQPDISFLHVNGDGVVSFRTDGKKVSASEVPKNFPVCAPGPPNSAYIIWKERYKGIEDQLIAQRVTSTGSLYWNQYGVPVTNSTETGDFAAGSDKSGKLFVAFVPRETDSQGDYLVKLQIMGQDGKKVFPDAVLISRSQNKKSSVSVTADGRGGVYIFWLENIENFVVLQGQYADASGKLLWGAKPLVISRPAESVFSFTAKTYGSSVYIAWQNFKADKDIYHQVISPDGKEQWARYGTLISERKGNQTNPQSIIEGNDILVTWTDDGSGDKNIFIQKFNKKGDRLWNKSGMPVINIKGDQFGQRILTDAKKGAIVTWIDRRVNSLRGNIYAQRINESGKVMWDSLGILVSSSKNTEKSYVSVIPDITGGAIVVFKEKRNGKNEIFGQKIFNTGTFISQIVAFQTEIRGDSVKISWYSANETSPCTFSIERTTQYDTTSWKQIGVKYSDGKASARYYETMDKPDITGTLFYRVVHSDKSGNIQPSDLSKIIYMGERKDFFVAQNSPNPFKTKTTISIYLPEKAEVKMEFFDSHLEKIKEMGKQMNAGINTVEFSAAGLNPGIYFYKVYAGDYVDVKKMVITN